MSYKYYLPLILPFTAFMIFFMGDNTTLFLTINHLGVVFPNLVWELLTTFGNKTFVLTLLFLLCWRKPNLLLAALFASIIAGVISSSLKPLFDLARPTDVLALSDYFLIGPKVSGHSFPSGHTMSAFAVLATVVFFFKKLPISIGMLVLATLVGLSRIMLGVHWPIDVLMGAMLGLASAYAGVQISQLKIFQANQYMSIIVTALYLLVAFKLFWKGTAYEDVQLVVRIIAVAGVIWGISLLLLRLWNIYLLRSVTGKKY